MSRPPDPAGPEGPPAPRITRSEFRRRGRAFGLEYDVGIRIMALSDPEVEISRPPLLPAAPRLALPDTGGGS